MRKRLAKPTGEHRRDRLELRHRTLPWILESRRLADPRLSELQRIGSNPCGAALRRSIPVASIEPRPIRRLQRPGGLQHRRWCSDSEFGHRQSANEVMSSVCRLTS